MRIAIRYARSGPAKYISHLDMQRSIGRAIRRARLPACYSKGFNPHLQMSFASPLSVGYETDSDYVELEVEDGTSVAQVEEALRGAIAPNMEVRGVWAIPDGTGKLMARNHSASYTVHFDFESPEESARMSEAVKLLVNSDAFVAIDKKGRERDIVPLIYEIRQNGANVDMRVANASDKSLNPAVVATALLKQAGLHNSYSVRRTECYARTEDGAVPFSELFETNNT